VDKQLCLPAPRWTEAYARRRTPCQVPDARGFQARPQLAAALLPELRDEGVLPFKYVVAACLYGNSPELLQAIEACPGRLYLVSMPADTRGWLQGPVLAAKPHNSQGAGRAPHGSSLSRPSPRGRVRPWPTASMTAVGIGDTCRQGPKVPLPRNLPRDR
jgi:SRSO17 transposase